MIRRLILPPALAAQIRREAEAAAPAECCGLLEGTTEDGTLATAQACHPTRNLAENRDRFEIDPARHLALRRRLRGSPRRLIGCYHSHPRGPAEPSVHDLAGAVEDNFIWLIAGAAAMAAFLHHKGAFHPLHLA